MSTPAQGKKALGGEAAVIREALDELCPCAYAVTCDLPEHEQARAAHAALVALEARLAAVERALADAFEVFANTKWAEHYRAALSPESETR